MSFITNYFKKKKNKIARFTIQTIINMLAAVLTALGATSCMYDV